MTLLLSLMLTAPVLLLWVPFFAGSQRTAMLGASLELWTGACVMAALGGLALSALIVPPALSEGA